MSHCPILLRFGLLASGFLSLVTGAQIVQAQAAHPTMTDKRLSAPARTRLVAQTRPGKKAKPGKMIVYIGTYTNNSKSKGIYIYQMDGATGKLTAAGHGPMTADPSFLAIAPSHKYLYAANEIENYNGKKSGAVSAFAIAPKTGALTFLNQQPSAGAGPCFVAVDAKSKNVLVANYGSGSVGCLPIDADGKLTPPSASIQHEGTGADPARQSGPHAHSITLDAANHFALAADLGLDKIFVYRFDANRGTLSPNATPFASVAPTAGPRHFAFHPSGRYAYVINELNSTVTAFTYEATKGELTEIQTLSSLPEGFTGNNSTAQILVHPSGKFLYGSNRGHNSIVIYAIEGETGKLRLIGHESTQGKIPRNFNIDPSGSFLIAANQETDNVVVFRIDAETGKLTPTGQTLDIPKPVCVTFLPVAP